MDVGICSHDPQHPDAHPDRTGTDCAPSSWHLVCRRTSRGYGWVGSGSCVDCRYADCRESAVTPGLGGGAAGDFMCGGRILGSGALGIGEGRKQHLQNVPYVYILVVITTKGICANDGHTGLD